MKKMIFIFLFVFGLVLSACGQVKVYTDQLIADSISFNGTSFVNEFSTDGTFGGNSDRAVPTEKAVTTYTKSAVDSLHHHANKGTLDATTSAYTIAKDALADESADSTHHHANKGTLDASTSAYTIAKDALADESADSTHHHANKGTLDASTSAYTTAKDVLADEAADSTHHHANKGTLDASTASYTTASATRLANLTDTIAVVINATIDTLTGSEVYSGYVFPIGLALNGFNIYRMEAYSPSEGDGTQYIKMYRRRAGADATVTSTAASIGGSAIIDTDYDDMLTSDYLQFGYYETGATTYTISVDVIVTFIRP